MEVKITRVMGLIRDQTRYHQAITVVVDVLLKGHRPQHEAIIDELNFLARYRPFIMNDYKDKGLLPFSSNLLFMFSCYAVQRA